MFDLFTSFSTEITPLITNKIKTALNMLVFTLESKSEVKKNSVLFAFTLHVDSDHSLVNLNADRVSVHFLFTLVVWNLGN